MRSGFVDLEIASLEAGTVQGSNNSSSGAIGYFHKAKTAALIGLLVKPNAGTDDLGVRFDEFGQVGRGGGKWQVPKIQYLAHNPCVSMLAVYSVWAESASRPHGCIQE